MATLPMARLSSFRTLLCALTTLTVGLDQVSAGAGFHSRDVFGEGQIPCLAPVYRNVLPGAAWVLPNSVFDLTFRSLGCECFDPTGESPRNSVVASLALHPICNFPAMTIAMSRETLSLIAIREMLHGQVQLNRSLLPRAER